MGELDARRLPQQHAEEMQLAARRGGAEIGLHLYYKFGKTPDLPRLPVEATQQ